jgi:hypothetical protein
MVCPDRNHFSTLSLRGVSGTFLRREGSSGWRGSLPGWPRNLLQHSLHNLMDFRIID